LKSGGAHCALTLAVEELRDEEKEKKKEEKTHL